MSSNLPPFSTPPCPFSRREKSDDGKTPAPFRWLLCWARRASSAARQADLTGLPLEIDKFSACWEGEEWLQFLDMALVVTFVLLVSLGARLPCQFPPLTNGGFPSARSSGRTPEPSISPRSGACCPQQRGLHTEASIKRYRFQAKLAAGGGKMTGIWHRKDFILADNKGEYRHIFISSCHSSMTCAGKYVKVSI